MHLLAMLSVVSVLVVAIATPNVVAQDDRQLSPAAALGLAIRELTTEADRAKAAGQLPRRQADFARTFKHEVNPAMVATRLRRPVDRDAFRDAYVRWQLTSFNPSLRDLDDRAFEGMMTKLPRLLANPRADRQLIDRLQRAVQVGELSELDADRLRDVLDELADRASRARDLNGAALRFRDWVATQVPKDGARPLQIRLERCASLLASGWNVDRDKAAIEQAFEDARRDRTLTTELREMLVRQAGRLVDRERLYIRSARVIDNRVALELASAAVYDFDVRRWARLLQRDSG